MKTLQYQLSNSVWVDVPTNRHDEFIDMISNKNKKGKNNGYYGFRQGALL